MPEILIDRQTPVVFLFLFNPQGQEPRYYFTYSIEGHGSGWVCARPISATAWEVKADSVPRGMRVQFTEIHDPNSVPASLKRYISDYLCVPAFGFRLAAGKAVAPARAKQLSQRIDETRATAKKAVQDMERASELSKLYVSTQIMIEQDSRGESYFSRDEVLGWLAEECDDALENLDDDISAAIRAGEIESQNLGERLAVSELTWKRLGYC